MWLWALEPLLSVKLSLLISQSEQSAPNESALSWATRQRHFKQKSANFSIMYFIVCAAHTLCQHSDLQLQRDAAMMVQGRHGCALITLP